MLIRTLVCAGLLFCSIVAPSQAELIAATHGAKGASLAPQQNGLSTITYIWEINDYAENNILALNATLSTIINSGTADMSGFEAETYREINGMRLGIDVQSNHILLSISSPHEVFFKAVDHLRDILMTPQFSKQWYERSLLQISPILASKNRRPEHILNVLGNFLMFPITGEEQAPEDQINQFGMPHQIIVRAPISDAEDLLERAARGLPTRDAPAVVRNKPNDRRQLPKGVIYIPDPDSHETLILLVKSQDFTAEDDHIATNLLMDYIGAYQGSEMFSVIRQELRASYDPRSDFNYLGENRSLLSLSATVAVADWPKIYNSIAEIYNKTRSGDISESGLDLTQQRLLGGFEYQFASNATWLIKHYLTQYPKGSDGEINLPIFRSLVEVDLDGIRRNPERYLPPIDDYLVILIGGTLAPPMEMRDHGYCELALSEPLRNCLTQLPY